MNYNGKNILCIHVEHVGMNEARAKLVAFSARDYVS